MATPPLVRKTPRELMEEIQRRSVFHQNHIANLTMSKLGCIPQASLTHMSISQFIKSGVNPCRVRLTRRSCNSKLDLVHNTMKRQAFDMGMGVKILRVCINYGSCFQISEDTQAIGLDRAILNADRGILVLELCHIILWLLYQFHCDKKPSSPCDIGAGHRCLFHV